MVDFNESFARAKKAADFWSMKAGQTVKVSADDFNADFQDILNQGGAEVEKYDVQDVVVKVVPISKVAKWATKQQPDWDRYGPEGAEHFHELGLISKEAIQDYDRPAVYKLLVTLAKEAGYEDHLEIGFKKYVDNIARAIKKGGMPPIVTIDGTPIDGRHRILAAIKLKRKLVPAIEMREATEAA